jgi:tetratricopeptide (TPR) repeat protein
LGFLGLFSSPEENNIKKRISDSQKAFTEKKYKDGLNFLKKAHRENPELFKKIAVKQSTKSNLFTIYQDIIFDSPSEPNLKLLLVTMQFAEIIDQNSVCWGKIGKNILTYLLKKRDLLNNNAFLVEKCFKKKAEKTGLFTKLIYYYKQDFFGSIDSKFDSDGAKPLLSKVENRIKGKLMLTFQFNVTINNTTLKKEVSSYHSEKMWQIWHQLYCFSGQIQKGIDFLDELEKSLRMNDCDDAKDFDSEKDLIASVRGSNYCLLPDYTKALSAFNYLTLKHPDDTNYWEEKGDILIELGEYDKAAKQYKESLAIAPNLEIQEKFDNALKSNNLRLETNNNKKTNVDEVYELKTQLASGTISEDEYLSQIQNL